ncbi:methyltransferase domain-containing protein [Polyangium mundeleinium]|uniref:Methyltransferase domain-containing protein n=1 Tax=Polyangium mundeleinium TaxID=2995306 RepID=A0ABT5EFR9_9BACT|nr:methyltransferase domain-containing protein [Polyangium mundeleinium]MDC0740159.1 methyltransferase domain-containing protein [Polyangium mundeleinium]
MNDTPPRGIEDSTATQTSNGIDGHPPGVSGVAGAAGSVDGGSPRPLPPRPGGSVPAPPRPSRVPVSGSSPPPRPNTNVPPPRASNPPAAPAVSAVPPAPAVPQIETSTETPAAAAAEPDRAASPPLPRRRSRRAVKTEDDTMPASEGQPALLDDTATPGPEPVAEAAPPEPLPAPGASDAEVIQPMRILSVGDDLPPVKVYSEPPPAMPAAEATSKPRGSWVPPAKLPGEELVEEGWTPRPPEVAVITAQFAAEQAQTVAFAPPPAAPPRPAMDTPVTPIEALEAAPRKKPLESAPELVVEVAEEEADDDVVSAVAEEARADEVDAFEEIEPERVSEAKGSAPTDAQQASAPKKPPPPPPPPRRQAPTVPDVVPAAAATSLPPPKGPPPPPAAQATPPPAASAPSKPISLPEPSRRRQRPWWEDLFDDDMIRTMDRTDAKVIRREADFIESCLGLEKGATILDLACGTGQHAVELASRGYGVVGYDLSLNMLALAADEAQGRAQKLNFLQGDMREMAFDQVFDGLYCWSTSFGYFDDEKNLDVLRRMHRALRIGGILVLDIINRDYVAPRQPSLVWFEGDGCVCMDEMQVDFFSSRLKVKRTAMFDDGRAREIEYSLRLYALHEIGKMMHDADFKVVEVTGHPAHPGVFFGSESPRLVIVAERK